MNEIEIFKLIDLHTFPSIYSLTSIESVGNRVFIGTENGLVLLFVITIFKGEIEARERYSVQFDKKKIIEKILFLPVTNNLLILQDGKLFVLDGDDLSKRGEIQKIREAKIMCKNLHPQESIIDFDNIIVISKNKIYNIPINNEGHVNRSKIKNLFSASSNILTCAYIGSYIFFGTENGYYRLDNTVDDCEPTELVSHSQQPLMSAVVDVTMPFKTELCLLNDSNLAYFIDENGAATRSMIQWSTPPDGIFTFFPFLISYYSSEIFLHNLTASAETSIGESQTLRTFNRIVGISNVLTNQLCMINHPRYADRTVPLPFYLITRQTLHGIQFKTFSELIDESPVSVGKELFDLFNGFNERVSFSDLGFSVIPNKTIMNTIYQYYTCETEELVNLGMVLGIKMLTINSNVAIELFDKCGISHLKFIPLLVPEIFGFTTDLKGWQLNLKNLFLRCRDKKPLYDSFIRYFMAVKEKQTNIEEQFNPLNMNKVRKSIQGPKLPRAIELNVDLLIERILLIEGLFEERALRPINDDCYLKPLYIVEAKSDFEDQYSVLNEFLERGTLSDIIQLFLSFIDKIEGINWSEHLESVLDSIIFEFMLEINSPAIDTFIENVEFNLFSFLYFALADPTSDEVDTENFKRLIYIIKLLIHRREFYLSFIFCRVMLIFHSIAGTFDEGLLMLIITNLSYLTSLKIEETYVISDEELLKVLPLIDDCVFGKSYLILSVRSIELFDTYFAIIERKLYSSGSSSNNEIANIYVNWCLLSIYNYQNCQFKDEKHLLLLFENLCDYRLNEAREMFWEDTINSLSQLIENIDTNNIHLCDEIEKILTSSKYGNSFVEQEIQLFERFGKHNETIKIILLQLKDIKRAEKYLNKHNSKDLQVYFLQIGMNINDMDMKEHIKNIVSKCQQNMDPTLFFQEMDSNVSLNDVYINIHDAVRRIIKQKNQLANKQAFYSNYLFYLKMKLDKLKNKKVMIDNQTVCSYCNEKIKNAFFIQLEDETLLHESCHKLALEKLDESKNTLEIPKIEDF
eukprot:TRINITY_DN2925_c0_g1_i2.p1 TRINITY_DN2925_c0_g1~~TRINITY_DN2925_c0_g1_i2.p1  ORF type:complete len:1028 (+),score=251.74 TRINITY_DN2925_c0_g1_i2:34-3117(+)